MIIAKNGLINNTFAVCYSNNDLQKSQSKNKAVISIRRIVIIHS